MNFSKSDETFGRASIDEVAGKALLGKMRKNRKVLVWMWWANVAFLLAIAAWCYWQVAPVLNGNFTSFHPSPSIPPECITAALGFSGMLGFISLFGLLAADQKVKMLILIGGLQRKNPRGNEEGHANRESP